jgi:hypothetical protein
MPNKAEEMIILFVCQTLLMYITDRSFAVKIAEQVSDTNKVIDHLNSIKKMIKRRGQAIFTRRFYDIIEGADNQVAQLLNLLKKAHKEKISSINNIIRYIKQESKNYNKTFTLTSNDQNATKDVEHTLQKEFPASICHTENTATVGLKITGEGLYYKRTLDTDVEKILH